jgi:protease-4
VFGVLEGDARVRAVVLLLGPLRASMASLYTLRRQVMRLRAVGKRVIGWLPGAGLPELYLATACDEIAVPRSGHIAVLGLRAEVIFLKDALDQVGIEADLESIAEYKTTPDTFRRSGMTEPHRYMLNELLDSYYDVVVGSIAAGRGMTPDAVRDAIDAMPFGAQRAADRGLVDAVLYEDELAAHLVQAARADDGQDPRGLDALTPFRVAAPWLKRTPRPTGRQAIGLVSVDGLMTMGRSMRPPLPMPVPFVQAQAGALSIIQALRQAEANRSVAAVVMHVETPGGSALASDLIWREVRRLRQRKPVVALMGAQATSGGYYISAACDRIVARPMTMTGSIGVWGGKFVIGGMLGKARVRTAEVRRGAMADMYSELLPFDDAQRARVREDLETTYARFVAAVAEGRRTDVAGIEQVARGRVWTGAQARDVGLVDELGDFETALETARELAGLEPGGRSPVVRILGRRGDTLPRPFADTEPGVQWPFGALHALAREHIWALSPWILRIGG